MDINAAAKEYGNGVITSLKKNRRILIMMLLFAAGMIKGLTVTFPAHFRICFRFI